MKRFVAVCTLIIALSSSVLAGHTTPGLGWCECDNQATCNVGIVWEDEAQTDIQQNQTPNNEVSELDIIIDALLILIRF